MNRKSSFSNLRRVLSYSNGSETKLTFSILLAIVTSISTLLIPYYIGKTIDFFDKDFVVSDILPNLLVIAVLILITVVFTYVMNTLNYKISYDIVMRLRNAAYLKINRLPISYIDKTSTGSIESLIINDCETISDGLLVTLNQLFIGLVTIISVLIIMLTINLRLAIIIAVATPITVLVTSFFLKSINKLLREQSKSKAVQTGFVNESISNISEIHSFEIEKHKIDDFKSINDEYRKKSTKATFFSSLVNPSTRLFNSLIYAIVAFVGSICVLDASITIGGLASLLAYATTFMKPINEISGVFSELTDSLACASRVFEFLDERENNDIQANAVNSIKGHLKIENLSFSYDGISNVIDNISLDIPAGTKVAIVGPTGCGKSTLINLLMRFYEPSSGHIYVDDVDLSDIPKNMLRSSIGMVPQDTWFKTTTIKNNITYGVHNVNLTERNNIDLDEDVEISSHILGIDSFINQLPNKYDEIISSRRDDISDGQKQLLSITRAYISKPSILILDEATSSVDAITERSITNAVRKLCEGRTSIVIAHRLATIVDADLIVVMEKGRIVELGNHQQLINCNGFYSNLYKSYVGE